MNEGVTLVLGGLGIKGISNIGTLQALSNHDMPIRKIVASGISSMAATQFALGRDMDSLTAHLARFFTENHRSLWGLERLSGMPRGRTRRVRDSFAYFLRERFFCQSNFKRLSIMEWETIEGDLQNFFGEVTPADFRMPLSISAINLDLGKEVLLEEGNLVDQLKAAIAFPGLFPPVKIGNQEFVGSTFYCELPLGNLDENDSPIVVIDIPSYLSSQQPGNVIETIARMDELRSITIKQKLLGKADRIFSLGGLSGFQWGNYKQISAQVGLAQQEMEQLLSRSDSA